LCFSPLHQGGNAVASVCLFVCVCVGRINSESIEIHTFTNAPERGGSSRSFVDMSRYEIFTANNPRDVENLVHFWDTSGYSGFGNLWIFPYFHCRQVSAAYMYIEASWIDFDENFSVWVAFGTKKTLGCDLDRIADARNWLIDSGQRLLHCMRVLVFCWWRVMDTHV